MQWCYSVVKIQAFRLDPFIITSRDFILAGNNTSIGNFLAITKTNSYTERMIFRSSILIFAQFHSVNNTWSLLTNCVYILSYCTNITRTGIIQINCFFFMVSGNVHCNSVDLLDCMYLYMYTYIHVYMYYAIKLCFAICEMLLLGCQGYIHKNWLSPCEVYNHQFQQYCICWVDTFCHF